mgnify:CR=1 FL=1
MPTGSTPTLHRSAVAFFYLRDHQVLLYHALGSEVRSTDLSDGLTADTLNGEVIAINLDPPRVNGEAHILVEEGLVDIEADNGVIHVIDTVIMPPAKG